MGHIHIGDLPSRSYKRGGPSRGWSFEGGTTVH